jgi:hypothetical protein
VIDHAVRPVPRSLRGRFASRRRLSLVLLLVGLGATVASVAGEIREVEAALLVLCTGFGALLAWILAATRVRTGTAALVSLTAGLGGVLGRVGRLDVHVGALLRALGGAWWNVVQSVLGGGEEHALGERLLLLLLPVLSAVADLASDAQILLQRVTDWMVRVVSGGPTFDPVSATIAWSLLLWGVAAWAAWMLRRLGRPVGALGPSALVLLGVLGSGEGGLQNALTLLAAMVLLLALAAYDLRVRHWETNGIGYPDVRGELAAVSIGLTIALVAASAGAAYVDFERIREALERPAEANGVDGADGESGPGSGNGAGQPPIPVGVSGLPRTHLLGAGPEFAGRAVMRVGFGRMGMDVNAPRYLRSVTYDRYTGAGWVTSGTDAAEYGSGQPVDVEPPPSTWVVRQEVETLIDLEDALFAAGELLVVDQEYQVLWRSNQDQFGALVEPGSYVAESFVSAASVAELRSAGEDYPGWVADRYLALPDSVPDRVLALARDLTATEPTPYDRARAIEDYLRRYEYSLEIAAPPAHQDVVDYFLFDLQEGFCDYYSTAMAVLARAAGIPARVALGYVSGSFDRTTGKYVVSDSSAHAWVEIYFPGLGWVEFEPTAGVDPIVRAAGETPEEGEDQLNEGSGTSLLGLLADALPLQVVAGAIVGVPLLCGLVWLVVDELRLRRGRPARAAATLYRRLRRQAARLSVTMHGGDTAYEFAASFSRWLERNKTGPLWRVLKPVAGEVDALVDFYVGASYAAGRLASSQRRRALRAYRALRWRLPLARLGAGRRQRL